MKRFLTLAKLIPIMMLVLVVGVKALEIKDYSFRVSDETWRPLGGEAGVVVHTLTSYDEEETGVIMLGFDFPFDDRTIDRIRINTNGFVRLGTNHANPNFNTEPATSNVNDNLNPFRIDAVVDGIATKLEGEPGNRVFIVEFRGFRPYNTQNKGDVQVRLYENGNIQYVYGPGFNGIFRDKTAYIFLCGNDKANDFIGVDLGQKATDPIIIERNATNYKDRNQFKQVSKLTTGKALNFLAVAFAKNIKPNDEVIYLLNNVYDANNNGPSLGFEAVTSPVEFTYKIVKKDAPNTVIYRALDPTNAEPEDYSITIDQDYEKYDITRASGVAAGDNGKLNLNSNEILLGEYQVVVELTIPGYQTYEYVSPFLIAFTNDIAVSEVVHPLPSDITRYRVGSRIPVQVKFRNTGTTNIDEFSAIAKIYFENETTPVYNDSTKVIIRPEDPQFSINTNKLAKFRDFIPERGIGNYRLEVEVFMKENQPDESTINNVLPRAGQAPYIFEVADNVDLLVEHILAPDLNIAVGRPVAPVVRIKNIGVTDLSENATLNVKVLNAAEETVYESSKEVESVLVYPKGTFVDVQMDESLILESVGAYTIIAEIVSREDNKTENNTKTQKFNVQTGLEGVYTIGTAEKAIDVARNFDDFDKALAAMHQRSVTGPVTFLLTEESYDITRGSVNVPALDLSSKIIGVSEKNTITFKAAPAIDTLENKKVVINMNTESGIGVLFGQSTVSTVGTAPVNTVFARYKNRYSKSEGYITFDGGKHKSLEFNLVSKSNFRAAFYLAQGASNITIKNVRINDANANPADGTAMPTTKFDGSTNIYSFDRDANYTAGILLRSITPYDKALYMKSGEMLNLGRLDTLQNTNNLIEGNVINGFSAGVASMGLGVLNRELVKITIGADGEEIKESTHVLAEYMNHNNKVIENKITNSAVAGVFFGFENNSEIKSNTISDNTANNTPVYGILLGNDVKEPKINKPIGYFNQNIAIFGNKIFRISSGIEANGITMVQNKNTYTLAGSNVEYVYPKGLNKNAIESNAITNIKGTVSVANLYGISVLTGREVNKKSPAHVGFRTKGDVIANNTIFFTNSNGVTKDGEVANIRLMQTGETKVINNLMYMALGDGLNKSGKSLVSLTSKMPTEENILIDRNVYFFTNDNSNTDLVRFYQTNEHDAVYKETGFYGEYSELEQWQTWTKMDLNSFVYDFSGEVRIEADGTPEVIKVAGNYPLNSKINNTGYIYKELAFSDGTLVSELLAGRDITGQLRGQADTRFDVGANEFFGEVYVRDFEVLKIISPNSYKPTTDSKEDGVFQVMTKAPVNVTALIRNNGNMPARRVKVLATIYREFSTGLWDSTYIETKNIGGGKTQDTIITVFHKNTYETYVDIDQYGHAVANFDIGNPDRTPVFVPNTYHEFKTYYTVPDMYREMRTTITPRYRIEIEIVDNLDQKPINNKIEKTYRFFVKKSNNDLLISAENAGIDILQSIANKNDVAKKDITAGALNYDSLKKAMNKMGLYQVMGEENPFYYFDVIDRKVWDARAYDYSVYNTLFWIDGHDKAITIFEANQLKEYLDNKHQADNWNYKKSLIVSSQEFLRANTDKEEFLKSYISATTVGDGNPLGADVDYTSNFIDGETIAKDFSFEVKATGFDEINPNTNAVIFSDENSKPAAMTLHTDGLGITSAATLYRKNDGTEITDNIAGSTTYGLTRNMIYLGQDWRHFGNGDLLLRGIFDYLNKHGSTLTPVELVDFEAIDRNKNVELSWATASELNSSHFEIEKALVGENGKTTFQVIATEPAAGKSNVTKSYGPIVDKDVNYGATYVYRLRSVDQDGTSSLSSEVEVSIDNFFGVSPNPASSNATYSYSIGEAQNAQIEIYDVTGKMVKSLFNGVAKANDSIQFNVSELANGSYTIVLKTATNTYTTKLSVRK